MWHFKTGTQRGVVVFTHRSYCSTPHYIADDQILTLVENGHADTRTQCTSPPLPAAMTALVMPNRQVVILSSSMKKLVGSNLGPMDYHYGGEELVALLNRGISPPHTKGSIELTALCLWLQSCASMNSTNGMYILTVGTTRSNPTLVRHKPPCCLQTHGRWGCGEVLAINTYALRPEAGTAR
jgi:hypothetical protein